MRGWKSWVSVCRVGSVWRNTIGRNIVSIILIAFGVVAATPAQAQNRLSVGTSVLDAPGGMIDTGVDFRYRVSYSCDLVSIPTCAGAVVTVDLPPELAFQSGFFPPADVASVMHDGSPTGGTVTFTFQPAVPAGNTGDLDITVRFPNGSTPDGTVTTMLTAVVNSSGTGLVPQMADLPPVTANASPMVDLDVALQGGFLDSCQAPGPAGAFPSTYQVSIGPSTAPGSLDFVDVAEVVLTLPAGVDSVVPMDGGVFNMMMNTVTWTSLGPVAVGGAVTVSVELNFPQPTFSDGQTVTATADAQVDVLDAPVDPTLVAFGPLIFMDTLSVFEEITSAAVSKQFADGRPAGLPPAEGQAFAYQVSIANTGNVPLDTLSVVDDGDGSGADIDAGIDVTMVTTGTYSPAPTSVTINVLGDMGSTPSVTSPSGMTDTALDLTLGGMLVAGERVIRIEWVFNGGAPAGMAPSVQAEVDAVANVGFPAGTMVDNHVTATWTASPTVPSPCGGVVPPSSGSTTDNFPLDVNDPYTYLNPSKSETSSGPYFPGDTVSFSLDVANGALANDPATGVVVTDLLPEFLSFSTGTETFAAGSTGVTLALFENIENFNGTGRTLLRWTLAGDLDPGETVMIGFDTTVVLGVIFGALTNEMGMTYPAGIEQECAGASAIDDRDLDGDADTTDTLCTATDGVQIAAVAQLRSEKFVQGQCDPGFTGGLTTGTTLPGGIVDWRVEVQNVQTVPMENVVIIDILPFVGDTGVRDLTPRLSLFDPVLIAPISPPPGGTVFYSLSGNPCRPEVGGPTSGCDSPNWTPIPPTPITSARSIKVEFGDRVLNPLDLLEFEWRMLVPADAPTDGSEAFNSFAFGSNRQDDGGFLGAEPNKVGIDATCSPVAPDDAMLGNFVWLDVNGDGDQDGGAEVGVNNVPVQLFDPGPDGLPRTGDDVLVLSSITADDALGNPGWYKFQALMPGDYYVQFVPPANFEVTVQGVGGAAVDSDTDPASACTDVVTLGASDNNPDIDMGLLAPTTASLGNYVWFDRNGDGVQNEAVTDGLNGVAVKLFVDDGDGNPEPGGDDGTPLQVTVTADDAFGNPGFYAFTELIPGTPYFVQVMAPPTATGFTTRNAGGDDTVDSDVNVGNGTTQVVTLAAGEDNPTLDAGVVQPSGTLSLGNLVWMDDGDDVFDSLGADMPLNGVRVNLYRDVSGDGLPQVSEYVGTTVTATLAGKDGRYRFDSLPAGDYIVEIPASNFVAGGALEGKVSVPFSTVDPNDDVDHDDSGDTFATVVVSAPVALSDNGEPTLDADDDLEDDDNVNFTLDFGFVVGTLRDFDFGDNPDAGAGSAQGNYQTTVFDGGAVHELTGPMGPYLGSCVDSDTGMQQNVGAGADDAGGALTVTHGACASPGDDEDGITFSAGILMMGGSVNVTVASTSANPCVTSGWIDWNRDGVFDNFAPEKILTDVAAGAFPAIAVPANAVPGVTYARFRCSSAGGDGPVGPAADGEVEDYVLRVTGADFGDAPDLAYGTLMASGGPVHGTNPTIEMYLGTCVDTEADGQPNGAADGDDAGLGTSRIGDCVDDENGVTFDTMLVRGQMAQVTVTASMPGRLDAWVDLDGVGGFAGADQIATDMAVVAGANIVTFMVPANAFVGTSYARFRYSTAGGLAPGGMAADGEVEDYAVVIKGFDYGDAPDTHLTTLGAGGPSHVIDPASSLYLGACADTELDAAGPLDGTGDDANVGAGTAGSCVAGDDEDGVTFSTMIVACQNASISVVVGASGRLDGWIDFGRDGSFATAGDQIATNMAVSAGANVLTVAVPCTATPGAAFARFRLSSTGGLGVGGVAMDGEVEDYSILLKALDYGDAPDTYLTTMTAGGPTHAVDPSSSVYLGSCVDTELDAGTPLDATGDDATAGTSAAGTCGGSDDEDGVVFTSMITACETASVNVTAGAVGRLDAWIDFDRNGTFEAGDQVFTNQALAAGVNTLSVSVPCDAVPGTSYARFRVSTAGGLGSSGFGMDGEVEDHSVLLKGLDFGDAPVSYTTNLPNGARHVVDPASPIHLGACVDTEADGQAVADGLVANGDDLGSGLGTLGTCIANDDEDGVTFDDPLIACTTSNVTVVASQAGLLDAWVDFDGDGSFEPGEQIFASQAVSATPTQLSYAVPCDRVTDDVTYARFRVSTVGGLGFNGLAMDGEVEDYEIATRGLDFGDAPTSYGTTFGSGGASHAVDSAVPLYLGACVDTEVDGQPATVGNPADGDDLGAGLSDLGGCVGNDDEDGVTFDDMVVACGTSNVTVTASQVGLLDGWLDFNGNGTFEASEQIFASQALAAGANALPYSVPCSAVTRDVNYARFRVSTAGGLAPVGTAANGEVEDYEVTTKGLDLGDAPDSYGTMDPATAASHVVDAGTPLHLGACVDTEAAGQVAMTGDPADGDDNATGASTVGTCASNDDEDGVTFATMIVACATDNEVTVTSVGAGALLDAWLDFDGDGTFTGTGEQIFASQALTGNDTLMFSAPCTAASGLTYARFRVSTAGGLLSAGPAMDGEVEDYQVTTKGLDFGDAPETYTTTASPSHVVDPGTPLFLGVCVDTEVAGQPTAGADGDDLNVGVSALGTCAGTDDEDGVTFDTPVVACGMADVTVTASQAGGLLDAWLDFDGNGTFEASDQIFTSQALTAGGNTLTFAVPCDRPTNTTSYARFRVSTAGSLAFDGQAMDGEVEDYLLTTNGLDFGDAPDTYGTTDPTTGASHVVDPANPVFLGACVDTEDAGQPVVTGMPADGDDLGVGISDLGGCADNDDEDGIAFAGMLVACGTTEVTVTASQTGGLDAWIDFGGDGAFDAADQVFSALPVPGGVSTQTIDVPCDARSQAVTYARFRISTSGGLGPVGQATNGEVEDYDVTTKGLDLGDAPDTYATTLGVGGARHVVDPGTPLFLGACVDTEADGQPVTPGDPANGDDLGAGLSDLGGCADTDDEDGVTFDDMVVACGTSNITVAASQAGLLDGWIDFDGNGTFDADEQVFTSEPVSATATSLPFDVSCDTVTQATNYARFRVSTAGGLSPMGPAMDGEIEDYEVSTKGLDFGDAPDTAGYPTLLTDDGARHVVQPADNPTLGTAVDTEPDGQPDTAHAGDDQNGTPDDEDGVAFSDMFVEGGAPVDVTFTGGATGGLVNGWIDWNADGDWDDAGEQIASDLALGAGASVVLSVAAPADAIRGATCARFRIDTTGGLMPTGLAMDGEIEDYPIAVGVEEPAIGIAKEVTGIEFLGDGEYAVDFQLLIDNAGNVPLSNVQVVASLATVFADAEGYTVSLLSSADFTVNPAFDGDGDDLLLTGGDGLAIGDSGVIVLQVILMPGQNPGPYLCTSTAMGDSPSGNTVDDDSQNGGDSDPDGNGDPADNDEPTEVLITLSPTDIPTLGEWALILLSTLLGLVGLSVLRRSSLVG